MDQMRMDAERGGRAIRRSTRTRRLAVVVAVQNVLVIACLVVILYLYWEFQSQDDSEPFVHINFEPRAGFKRNQTIETKNSDRHKVEVSENGKSFKIQCTGPYVWFMEVCYKDTLMLQLQVRNDSISSFILENSSTVVCRRLQSTVYLKAEEEASVFMGSPKFTIYNITGGLSYLLGTNCDY